MNTIDKKRQKEKLLVSEMISLYCKKQHLTKKGLCRECFELLEYAKKRSDCCPFMEHKTFCSNCKVHCYNSEMRLKIKAVMKFSGPRLLFRHPLIVLSHGVSVLKEKRRLKNEDQ